MDSPELLQLVENCPPGGDALIMRMLHILTDGGRDSWILCLYTMLVYLDTILVYLDTMLVYLDTVLVYLGTMLVFFDTISAHVFS